MKTQYGEICCRLTFGWIFLRALSAAPRPARRITESLLVKDDRSASKGCHLTAENVGISW